MCYITANLVIIKSDQIINQFYDVYLVKLSLRAIQKHYNNLCISVTKFLQNYSQIN